MNEPCRKTRAKLQHDLDRLIDGGHLVTLEDLADAIIHLDSQQQADAITLRRWGFCAQELRDLRTLGQLDQLAIERRPTPWRAVGEALHISHVSAQALARRALSNMLGWLTLA